MQTVKVVIFMKLDIGILMYIPMYISFLYCIVGFLMGWLCVPHQPDSPPRPGSHDDRQILAQNLRRLFQRKFHINKSFTSRKLTQTLDQRYACTVKIYSGITFLVTRIR